jgi:N-acetylmuramoyl-L-alanine amidase
MHILAWVGGLLLALSLGPPSVLAAPLAQAPAASHSTFRLFMDLTAVPQYRLIRWTDPARLWVNVEGASPIKGLSQPIAADAVISKISFFPSKIKNSFRLRIDLKKPVTHQAHLETDKNHPRLVIGLTEQSLSPTQLKMPPAKPKAESTVNPQQMANTPVAAKTPSKIGSAKNGSQTIPITPGRKMIVVLDAGHGGKDTGALGQNGTQEKNVVLAIARKLYQFIRAEPGMKPVMTRSGDYFVDLRKRVDLARKAKADLFVSLHADAYINDLAKGSSVFTLSERGATSEAARWLADRENASLVGGVKLSNKDKVLASVLLDLSQNVTLEASDLAAGKVLRELKKDFHIHHSDIQKAGFVVLTSPDIPSMLIETAFISNSDEERHLRDSKHQEQIARAIFKGIRAYFAHRRPGISPALRVADAGDSLMDSSSKKIPQK